MQPIMNFHSGRRLAKLRELNGNEQKQLSGDSPLAKLGLHEGFPCRVPKTISRWEQNGIPTKELKSVAQSFHLPLWVFVEKAVDEEMLVSIAANPEFLPAYQAVVLQRRMLGQASQVLPQPSPDASFALWLQWLRQGNQESFGQERRPYLKKTDAQGWTLLHWAVYLQSAAMVEFFLLQPGVPVNQADSEGYTPLMCAAHYGQPELVIALLTAGAQADLADQLQWTALAWAGGYGHLACVQALLQAGANPDICDLQGVSPLNRAAAEAKTGVALLLLAQGANPALLDDQGHSALHYAMSNGDGRLVKQLSHASPRWGSLQNPERQQWAG